VAEVKPGRSIRYERVKDYWGKDLPVNKGLYNFDYRVSDYYRDSTVALEALKAGQFDYWQEMTAKNWAGAYNVPAVAEGRLIKEETAERQSHRACRVLCSISAGRCSRTCACARRSAC
jgi:microcin C transport system substrate-binding protein